MFSTTPASSRQHHATPVDLAHSDLGREKSDQHAARQYGSINPVKHSAYGTTDRHHPTHPVRTVATPFAPPSPIRLPAG